MTDDNFRASTELTKLLTGSVCPKEVKDCFALKYLEGTRRLGKERSSQDTRLGGQLCVGSGSVSSRTANLMEGGAYMPGGRVPQGEVPPPHVNEPLLRP